MAKKLLSLSLVFVMLSVATLAAPGSSMDLFRSYTAQAQDTFSYAGEEIQFFTETVGTASAKHEAVDSLPAWDGETKTAITKGSGTEAAPYEIATAAELAWFAEQCNTVNPALHAKLVRDINMAQADGTKNNWATFSFGVANGASVPTKPFAGVLDGQGHNIYNYSWTGTAGGATNLYYSGMFKSIDGGIVKNLNLIDVAVVLSAYNNGYGYGSVLCGYLAGADSLIENVYISGNVSVMQSSSSVCAFIKTYGGIVGYLYTGTVKDCYSDVNVNLTSKSSKVNDYMKPEHTDDYDTSSISFIGVGGIVGFTYHKGTVTVENCGNGGDIFAPFNRRVGGVVGAIKRCHGANYQNYYNLWNSGNVTGYGDVAGVCGWMKSDQPLNTNLYNTGDITAVSPIDTYASGIANHGTTARTRNAYSTGNVYLKNTGVVVGTNQYDFGDVDGGFNDKMALLYANDAAKTVTSTANVYPTGSDFMVNESTPKWAISYAGTDARVTASLGTGLAPEDMEGSAILATVGEGFVADFGINGNLPILATRKSALVLNDSTYELAENKSITVKLASSGYAALNVANIIEGATLVVTPKNGSAYNLEVAKTGIITLDTKGADEVTVSAASGSRVLVTEPASLAIASIDSAAIKASFASEDSATIILALFDGEALEKVAYAADVQVADGKISAVIDLTGIEVADCQLRAYVWENGTLAPVNAEVEVLQ